MSKLDSGGVEEVPLECCLFPSPDPDARRRAIISYATYLGWLDLRRGPADIVPEVAPGPNGTATIDDAIRILLDGITGTP